jgi:HopA1 effector protein family
MKEQLLAELTKIVHAVIFLSPTSFSFAGLVVSQSDPAMQHLHSLYSSQNQLVTQLQQTLYSSCYCKRFTGHSLEEQPNTVQDSSFLQALSEANTGHERWDSGWQIYQTLPSGQVLAHKYGLTRLLWPGEFLAHDGFGMAPRTGTNISIFVAKESRTMQPGFYFAFGETVTDQQDDYSIVRFYWNIKESIATTLIRLITRNLNRFQVPFRLKCLGFRAHFSRADAAVLFVSKRYYRITSELLVDIYQEVREHLKSDTPLFTKQLANGLGLAEDPGNGESFGMSRCRIFAEGLWGAYVQGLQTEQARVQEVVKQFGNNGISLEHPYLSAGSIDHYEFTNQ